MMHRFTRARKRQPLDEIDAERICLIKPSALGDVVQSLPVLSALRRRFPRAHIAWVVNRAYAELLENHPQLDEIVGFERPRGRMWSPSARRAVTELRTRLRAGRYDLAVDLQGLLRSGLMTFATGARRRVGLGDSREGARFFYTDLVNIPAENMSAVDRYWLAAEALGAGSGPKQFVIAAEAADREWANRHLAGLSGVRLAIHPGARWVTKRWPAEHFAEVARRLDRESKVTLVLVGGPDETAAAECIASAVRSPCVNLAGKTTLKQLAAVLSSVHLLMTNDSGPMHLAAALGIPVVALFTCTSPRRARPYGPGHVLLETGVWCAASYLKNCGRMDCMAELTPDRVWPAIRERIIRLQSQFAA